MSKQDVENFQSFCRKYINKTVKTHFRDVDEDNPDSLSVAVPRQAIKRICLHSDSDPLTLTVGRLLIWWVEARGLFDEYIYGIPSTDFEIKYTYYPQIKLHFKEDRYLSVTNNRKPIRSEVSFRWRSEDFSTQNITALATKIQQDFARPIFKFDKGRECWTYWDDQKGYRFTVYVQTELDAKKIIEAAIRIQDDTEPDWDKNLREHKSNVDYNIRETVRVMGENIKKPRRRPVGTVQFEYAELFIPGTTKPIILVDATGYRPQAIRYL